MKFDLIFEKGPDKVATLIPQESLAQYMGNYLRALIEEALKTEIQELRVDLRSTENMEPAVLQTILQVVRQSREKGQIIKFVNLAVTDYEQLRALTHDKNLQISVRESSFI